jgi:hypothetical protein
MLKGSRKLEALSQVMTTFSLAQAKFRSDGHRRPASKK